MQNAKNVSVGKPKVGGAIHRAPVGTELPKNVKDVLNEAFKNLGYCSEDGLANENTPESENQKAWGGDNVLTLQSSKEDKFVFKLIESLNADVLKTVYGEENVKGDIDTGIEVKANNKEIPESSWVFDMIMKGGVLKRIVVPSASVSEIEEIKYVDEEAVGYGITLLATADKDGNTHYEYIQNQENAASKSMESKEDEK